MIILLDGLDGQSFTYPLMITEIEHSHYGHYLQNYSVFMTRINRWKLSDISYGGHLHLCEQAALKLYSLSPQFEGTK